MNKMLLAAAAATAIFSTAAFAAVTIDDNGYGFVGKGDVQLAYGWNNKALQNNAGGVTFTYQASETYEAVCVFTTGEGTRGERTHYVEHNVTSSVIANVAYLARKNSSGKDGEITGFNLNGFGTSTASGEAPVVGGPCMGNEGHGGEWGSVTSLGTGEGGLYVNYGGNSILLPETPVL